MYKKKWWGILGVLVLALGGCAATMSVDPVRLSVQAEQLKGGITAVAIVDESGQDRTEVPVTFGQVFKDGDVPAGASLRATVNGKDIPIQVDGKATNPDHSLRHAVVTVVVPKLPASGQQVVVLATGGDEAASEPVTLDDLLATDFDATVSLDVDGKTYTASARALLKQAKADDSCRPWGQQCSVWLSGPQVSEWIVGAPLQSSDGPSPHLAARFYVRAYAGKPIHSVRVNIVIENDWTWVPKPHDITYDARLTAGDEVYSKKDLTHYRQTRWHRVMWWGDKGDVYARLDGHYLQASKAISHYADTHPTDAFLDTVIQSVEPMSNGDQTDHMNATGAQPAIGPLPRWTTAYVLSMDPRAFRWMLANDDAAGSYDIFYRDRKTGRPVTITDYPYMTLLGTRASTRNPRTRKYESFPKCKHKCGDPYKANAAHEPSVGYVSYMVTGDFWYLEQLEFWADWNELQINPDYRGHSSGLLWPNQVRAQAWGLRTLGDVAWITPDDAPLKSYFMDILKNNLDWYNKRYLEDARDEPLGAITAKPYAVHYHGHTSLAPWQDDFFTWAVGHLAGLGFDGAAKLLEWKARFPVGRMVAPGFCYVYASSYTLAVRNGKHAPIFDTFEKVYEKSVPRKVAQMDCGGEAMARHLGHHYKPGDMYGYPWSPTGYPANMQPALAAAVDAGVPGAEDAWKLFITRPTRPDYTNYANFAIVPRPDGSPKTDAGGRP